MTSAKRPLPPEVAAILARRIPPAWQPAAAAQPQARLVLRLIEAPPATAEAPPPPVFAWLRRLARDGEPPLEVERGGLEHLHPSPRPAGSADASTKEVLLLHPSSGTAEALLSALARRRNALGSPPSCLVLLPRNLGNTAPLWREAGALDVFVSPRRLPEVVLAARHRLLAE